MARARELLLTTDRSIADIAEEVGYPDQFYFSRQFQAVTGSSPRHFRRPSSSPSYGEYRLSTGKLLANAVRSARSQLATTTVGEELP